jgi:hypothetical protein
MRRYATRAHVAIPWGDDEAQQQHSVTACEIHESEAEPARWTGLYDAAGVRIYSLPPERVPLGFHHHQSPRPRVRIRAAGRRIG